MACGLFTALLPEVVQSLSSFRYERPSTLRGVNLSFSGFDGWGHVGTLGSEPQQVATGVVPRGGRG